GPARDDRAVAGRRHGPVGQARSERVGRKRGPPAELDAVDDHARTRHDVHLGPERRRMRRTLRHVTETGPDVLSYGVPPPGGRASSADLPQDEYARGYDGRVAVGHGDRSPYAVPSARAHVVRRAVAQHGPIGTDSAQHERPVPDMDAERVCPRRERWRWNLLPARVSVCRDRLVAAGEEHGT